ncbi:MAG: hypothetical protein ACEPOZ_20855 [Marinifilaceae bacterium]
MKKTFYKIAAILILGTIFTSCAIDKKCPAYSKVDLPKVEKNA